MATLSAGSYELNHWLCGGYECGVITVVYGPSGSGKTNFCLLAATSQAKQGNKVLYIDTEGGFSVERVRQLVPVDTEKVLQNILLLSPTNFAEQAETFEQLLKHVKNPGLKSRAFSGFLSTVENPIPQDSRSVKQRISLIIVDGITMLYRLDAASARQGKQGEIQEVNAALANQMRTLAEIARKQHLPALVTSQTYLWDAETRMVAGDLLRYWSKCHIELVYGGGKRTAYLRKHRSLGERSLGFSIVDAGIKRRGWI